MAPERNLSTTALMERIPSRWPRPEWPAPWNNYIYTPPKFAEDVSLQAMRVHHTLILGARGDLLGELAGGT
nr:hypothetical protein [Tanacetum cinerariifolium]